MMELFLSGSLPLIDFVICDVMSDMANKLLSLSDQCACLQLAVLNSDPILPSVCVRLLVDA